MQFFLLFYDTDVAGIDPGLAGLALMVGKLTVPAPALVAAGVI